MWVLRVDQDGLAKGEERPKARFYWVPIAEAFKNQNVRFEPTREQQDFRVKVKLRDQ